MNKLSSHLAQASLQHAAYKVTPIVEEEQILGLWPFFK